MKIIMLVQERMKPIPDGIAVLADWGRETVIVGGGGNEEGIFGAPMLLEGSDTAFISWLSPFDAVWTTDSPMMGRWHAVHIKPESVIDNGLAPMEGLPFQEDLD